MGAIAAQRHADEKRGASYDQRSSAAPRAVPEAAAFAGATGWVEHVTSEE